MSLASRRIVLQAALVALFLAFAYANLARWHETGRPVGLGATLLEAFTASLFLIRRPPLATSARPLAWMSASLGAFAMLGARPVAHPDAGPLAILELVQLAGFAIVLVALGGLGRSVGIVGGHRGRQTGRLFSLGRDPARTRDLVRYLRYAPEDACPRHAVLL